MHFSSITSVTFRSLPHVLPCPRLGPEGEGSKWVVGSPVRRSRGNLCAPEVWTGRSSAEPRPPSFHPPSPTQLRNHLRFPGIRNNPILKRRITTPPAPKKPPASAASISNSFLKAPPMHSSWSTHPSVRNA